MAASAAATVYDNRKIAKGRVVGFGYWPVKVICDASGAPAFR